MTMWHIVLHRTTTFRIRLRVTWFKTARCIHDTLTFDLWSVYDILEDECQDTIE